MSGITLPLPEGLAPNLGFSPGEGAARTLEASAEDSLTSTSYPATRALRFPRLYRPTSQQGSPCPISLQQLAGSRQISQSPRRVQGRSGNLGEIRQPVFAESS